MSSEIWGRECEGTTPRVASSRATGLVGDRAAYRLARPVDAITLPGTVQALLAARIDRLPAADRRLLELAAIIGQDVPLALLRAVADEDDGTLHARLGRLQEGEFIHETRPAPDAAYGFKHALTQEVAYGSVPPDRRRALHARLVSTIETLHADRLAEQVERLAHHAVRAELGHKATRYLRQAGQKAAARSALSEAKSRFEQALSVLATLPESTSTLESGCDLRLELPVLSRSNQVRQALELLHEADALADRLDDDALRLLGSVLRLNGGGRVAMVAALSPTTERRHWASNELASLTATR